MLRRYRSHDLQILCRCLAFVGYFFVLNGLPLIEGAQAGLFNGRDVNENIPPTSARRLDKSVPLVGLNHFTVPLAILKLRC